MTIDEILCPTPEAGESMRRHVEGVFKSEAGYLLLAALCKVQHPFSPSVSTSGSNDPQAVAAREGRREVVSWLCKMAGFQVR